MTKGTKAVIYCRVGTMHVSRPEYSLDGQEKLLREYAAKPRNNIDVVQVFRAYESAGAGTGRRVFNEMMGYVRMHRIPVIIVASAERLTRNFADVRILDEWIYESRSHQIHLAGENRVLAMDSRTSYWFAWRIKSAIADYYRKSLLEKMREGRKLARMRSYQSS